ncbi:uncharacterized protein LOC125764764 [Anopheles funestus]|uniref:Uncharacterized protein n=1 Tax=Anopheles funestus TaxID=62324 RepID=A0A182RP23_ANOFN|nr:uncharacterized protein LOC125764764 [Anopheles funestus]
MTIGSVKHSNVPQPAAASSGRVTSAYDYNGTGSGGVGGGISGSGSLTHGVGGNGRSSGIGGGRISPHSASNSSSAFVKMRSSAKRCLFDIRPDPIDTKRICDENDKAERQRAIKRFEFDTHTCRSVASSGSSSSSGGLHHRHHHQ